MKFKHYIQYARKYKHYKFQFEVPELVTMYKELIDIWVKEENESRAEQKKDAKDTILQDDDYKGHPRKLAAALKEWEEDDEYRPVTAKDYDACCYDKETNQRVNIDPLTGAFELDFSRAMGMQDLIKKGNAMHNRRFRSRGKTVKAEVANEAAQTEVL
jgi:hypothetical protein